MEEIQKNKWNVSALNKRDKYKVEKDIIKSIINKDTNYIFIYILLIQTIN